MKSKKKSDPVPKPVALDTRFSSVDGFALVFGLFLGLAIIKFGNPVILDDKVSAPASFAEACSEPDLEWKDELAGVSLVVDFAACLDWLAVNLRNSHR